MFPQNTRSLSLAIRLMVSALGIALWASSARADTFLAVDFNRSTGPSHTQPGFIEWLVEGNPAGPLENDFPVSASAAESGRVLVSILSSSGTFTGRDRGRRAFGVKFAAANLYRDVLSATGKQTAITIRLSGLNPGTGYQFSFYALDASYSSNTAVFNATAGREFGQRIAYDSGAAASYDADISLDVAATSGTATTDATGSVTFVVTQSGGVNNQAFLNGFSVAALP